MTAKHADKPDKKKRKGGKKPLDYGVRVARAGVRAARKATKPTPRVRIKDFDIKNPKRLVVGQPIALGIEFKPADTTERKLRFRTSDKRVAKVNNQGHVTPLEPGTVTIRARSRKRSDIKDSIKVKVVPPFRGKAQLIAHRGYSSIAPENSLAAYTEALESGFDGIECDVHETLDSLDQSVGLMLMHDSNLNRMCGINAEIENYAPYELAEIPITGGNGTKNYPTQFIPSFDQYLDVLDRGTAMAVVEVKDVVSQRAADAIVGKLLERGFQDRCLVQSFRITTLRYLKRAMHTHGVDMLSMLLLKQNGPGTQTLDLMRYQAEGADGINVSRAIIDADMVVRAKKLGMKVGVWTVDSAIEAAELLDMGVDFLTSNTLVVR